MKYNDIINIQDLFIAPFYLLVLISIALLLKKKYTQRNPIIRKYFMPALYVRFIGCILSAMMYQYYYHGGDTFIYFNGSLALYDIFWERPSLAFQVITSAAGKYPSEALLYFSKYLENWAIGYTQASNTMHVIKIGAIINLITYKSYVSTSLIITFFSFIGCWKLFEVFYMLYPRLHKQMAIATLFIPSVFFWGAAGLMKDTIIIASIGYSVWGAYYLFIKNRKRKLAFFYFSIGMYLITSIKPYVAMALFPSLIIWIFIGINSKIRNATLKKLIFPLLLLIGLITSFILFKSIVTFGGQDKYALKNIVTYAENMQTWHKYVTEKSGGVGYDLGEFTPSLGGLLSAITKSINVTLFRPYIWEAKKVILLPTLIESMITLFFTIYVFFKIGIVKIIKYSFQDSNILFCLIFSFIFAFAVGFSTYNFGALARYKIPCLPFYFIALFLILNASKIRSRKRIIERKTI